VKEQATGKKPEAENKADGKLEPELIRGKGGWGCGE